MFLSHMPDNMYIAAPVYLLLQATPFRDYLAQIAQQESPVVTGISALLMDLVTLMNQVWGDKIPHSREIDIRDNLLVSIRTDWRMDMRDGKPVSVADFVRRLLVSLWRDFDSFVYQHRIPTNKIESLFEQKLERTASHAVYNHDHQYAYYFRSEWISKFSTPEEKGDVKCDLITALKHHLFRRDPEWDDFTECSQCHRKIDLNLITGKWTALPQVLFFDVLKPNRGILQLPSKLYIHDGYPVERSRPLQSDSVYSFRGFLLQDTRSGHLRTVVRHSELEQWFVIDDKRITHTPNNSPNVNDIVKPGEGVSFVMYIQEPGN